MVSKSLLGWFWDPKRRNDFEQEEDDLNSTDDGEATEKPQGAPNHAQLGVELHLLVSLDVVEGGRVKVDLHKLQGWGWLLLTYYWYDTVSDVVESKVHQCQQNSDA